MFGLCKEQPAFHPGRGKQEGLDENQPSELWCQKSSSEEGDIKQQHAELLQAPACSAADT